MRACELLLASPAVALRAVARGIQARRGPPKAAAQRCMASSSGHWTLDAPATHELVEKKSRFLAYAWPVASGAEALARVREASDPGASHNCFAWRIGAEQR